MAPAERPTNGVVWRAVVMASLVTGGAACATAARPWHERRLDHAPRTASSRPSTRDGHVLDLGDTARPRLRASGAAVAHLRRELRPHVARQHRPRLRPQAHRSVDLTGARRTRLRRAAHLQGPGLRGHRERHGVRVVGRRRHGGVVGASGHAGARRRPPVRRHRPDVGVTSTMVIDPASGTLFASAEVLSGSSVKHVVVRPRHRHPPGAVEPRRRPAGMDRRRAAATDRARPLRRPRDRRLRRQLRRLRQLPRLGRGCPRVRAPGRCSPTRCPPAARAPSGPRRGPPWTRPGDIFVVTGNGERRAGPALRPRQQRDRVVTDARRAPVLRAVELGPGQRR